MSFANGQGLHLVMTGAPGTGKGTQAGVLKRKYGLCHLSTGEMLREEVKKGSEIGNQLKDHLAAGGFAPDELMIKMVSARIDEDDCKNGFILDGFPRTIRQAEVLADMLEGKGISLNAVLEIIVPDEIIIDRILGRYTCMTCGESYSDKYHKPKTDGVCDICGGTKFSRRLDDTRETIERRLKKYRDFTYPTISYYKEKGLLKSIDGNGSVEEVAARIEKSLQGAE